VRSAQDARFRKRLFLPILRPFTKVRFITLQRDNQGRGFAFVKEARIDRKYPTQLCTHAQGGNQCFSRTGRVANKDQIEVCAVQQFPSPEFALRNNCQIWCARNDGLTESDACFRQISYLLLKLRQIGKSENVAQSDPQHFSVLKI